MASIWSGALMLDHTWVKGRNRPRQGALSAVTANGIGTVAGKDSTDTIIAGLINGEWIAASLAQDR